MLTLLNTRPNSQGQVLSELLKTAHIESIACPSLEIVFQPYMPQTLHLHAPDKLIFISANAVAGLMAMPEHTALLNCPTYAIGQATAKALQAHGINTEAVQQIQFDSEHFLQQPDMQDLSGQTLVIIKGEKGRQVLAKTLIKRGAKVIEWPVYRRKPSQINTQAWLDFTQKPHSVVLFTSVDSYRALKDSLLKQTDCPKGFDWLQQQAAIVFSQRIGKVLQQEGWQGPLYPVSIQSNQGILEVLQTIQMEKGNK